MPTPQLPSPPAFFGLLLLPPPENKPLKGLRRGLFQPPFACLFRAAAPAAAAARRSSSSSSSILCCSSKKSTFTRSGLRGPDGPGLCTPLDFGDLAAEYLLPLLTPLPLPLPLMLLLPLTALNTLSSITSSLSSLS